MSNLRGSNNDQSFLSFCCWKGNNSSILSSYKCMRFENDSRGIVMCNCWEARRRQLIKNFNQSKIVIYKPEVENQINQKIKNFKSIPRRWWMWWLPLGSNFPKPSHAREKYFWFPSRWLKLKMDCLGGLNETAFLFRSRLIWIKKGNNLKPLDCGPTINILIIKDLSFSLQKIAVSVSSDDLRDGETHLLFHQIDLLFKVSCQTITVGNCFLKLWWNLRTDCDCHHQFVLLLECSKKLSRWGICLSF